jgi:hypothetical protein
VARGWTKDSVGETPTDAVGTTALPNQTQSNQIQGKQTRTRAEMLPATRIWAGEGDYDYD